MKSTTSTLGRIPLTTNTAEHSPRGMARIAGILYIVIAFAAAIAHFYIPTQLLVPGDAAATANNILAGEGLFRIAITSEYVILLSEVALSTLLYFLLKPVSKPLALIAAVFRLTMTAIHGLNLLNYFVVLFLLKDVSVRAAFEVEQINALVQLFLAAHESGFAIGVVFLVPHVFLLAYLILKSGYFPKMIGVLFLLAACGYLYDSAALLFIPGYGETPAVIALLIATAEIAFPIWLLAKGVDDEQWQNRAQSSLS